MAKNDAKKRQDPDGGIGVDGLHCSPRGNDVPKGEDADRARRMQWWREARLGMLVVYGPYSHPSMFGSEAVYWDKMSMREYDKLARALRPKPGAAREWAALAKKAGMKYVVLCAKHGDGFCMWDTEQTEFNSVKMGPKRDMIREGVEACREFGLKVGLGFVLNSWRDPDCARAAKSERARRRYIAFIHGCVRELMSNYGKIDIMWYDYPAALKTPELWESHKLNRMVRELQPDIIINNRSMLTEDFDTPEEHITAQDLAWESCVTLTGTGNWGFRWEPEEDWASPRTIIEWIRQVTAGAGNLLVEFGPEPDGSAPKLVEERFLQVGKWLKGNEEAVYGMFDRVGPDHFPPWLKYGRWTLKGNVGYFWCRHWRGRELVIADEMTRVKRISLLKEGRPVRFTWEPGKLVLLGLPEKDPDNIAHTTIFKIEFAGEPRRQSDHGYPLVWCMK